jgi:hypothetical protein
MRLKVATPTIIGIWNADGEVRAWEATTCRALGKSEEFLECQLAAMPSLLGFESRRTGIHGPYKIFRQIMLPTPTGREIFPDIVFLAASGHLVVVEVKLADNPELRDRSVIAQIVEYAGSFAALSEEQLLSLFPGAHGSSSWEEFIALSFPAEPRVRELAEVLQERIFSGEINLIIACDGLPPGTRELIAGVASQSALGFELDVVEVIPFVCKSSEELRIAFVPAVRLSTEIVARTAVTVTYRQSDAKPSTIVAVNSPQDISEKVEATRQQGRNWSESEVVEAIQRLDNPTLTAVFDLSKRLSHGGKVITDGVKKAPSFGLHVAYRGPNGQQKRRCLFSCPLEGETVWVYLNAIGDVYGSEIAAALSEKLSNSFGDRFTSSMLQPPMSFSVVGENLPGFSAAFQWLLTQQIGKNVEIH